MLCTPRANRRGFAHRLPGGYTPWARALGAVVAAVLVLSPGPMPGGDADDSAQIEDRFSITDFQTRRVDPDSGRKLWTLRGRKAVMQENSAQLNRIVYMLFPRGTNRETIRITSPGCRFDRNTKDVTSTAPLYMECDSYRLSGRGYKVEADKQLVHVRHNVQMVVKKVSGVHSGGGNEEPSPGRDGTNNE